jgi:hypothetical protein
MFKSFTFALLLTLWFSTLSTAQTIQSRSISEVNEISICLAYIRAGTPLVNSQTRIVWNHSWNQWVIRMQNLPFSAQSIVVTYVDEIEQSLLNDLRENTKNTMHHIQITANRCVMVLGRSASFLR